MQDKVSLTPDAERRLISAIKEGVDLTSLIERFGVSKEFIWSLTKRENIVRGDPWYSEVRGKRRAS